MPVKGDRFFAVQTARKLLRERITGKEYKTGDSKKEWLIEKAKEKLGLCNDNAHQTRKRPGKVDDSGPSSKVREKSWNVGNKNAAKDDMSILFGWLMYNEKLKKFTQVKEPTGGGMRSFQVSKKWTRTDMLQFCKNLFFVDGNNDHGKLDDFEFDIVDNIKIRLQDGMTAEEILENLQKKGVKVLKCYMTTKRNTAVMKLFSIKDKPVENAMQTSAGSSVPQSNMEAEKNMPPIQQSIQIISHVPPSSTPNKEH